MIILLKIFLAVVLSIIFIVFAFSQRLKIFQKLGVISSYALLLLFISNPQIADQVAHYFSIKNGTDLVIYVVIAIMSLMNIVLYVGQISHHNMITKIIREGAKDNAKKCE